jgi:hypothetical protein
MRKIGKFFYSLGVRYKSWFLLLVGIGILLQIFVFQPLSNPITISLVALWVLLIGFYKFEGRVSVGVALFLIQLCLLLLIFGLEEISEKTATWAFTFLWIGVGQMFIEFLRREKGVRDEED